jgi:cell division protease FtsH
LQTLLKDADPLHKVTIVPRGQALGATMALPEKDRYGYGAKWLHATMRVLCGGRIAEKRHCGDVSSGAAQDIEHVTMLVRAMVVDWGMSEKLGFVKYSPDSQKETFFSEKPYSDETAGIIDNEIRRINDEAYHDAERFIDENWDKIEAVAQGLLKHETLDADEVRRLCLGETLDKPTLSGILAGEAVPSTAPSAESAPRKTPQPDLPKGLAGGSLPQPGVG